MLYSSKIINMFIKDFDHFMSSDH